MTPSLRPAPGPVLLCYLKPSDFCSVACAHCYLPLSVREDRTLMTRETLSATAAFLSGFARSIRARAVDLLFHGGEPLSVPLAWYDDCCQLLVEPLRAQGLDVPLSMQSSLIPFRPAHVPLLRDTLAGNVGVSVDLGAHRTVAGSNVRYLEVLARRLQTLRGHDVHPGASLVPARDTLVLVPQLMDWMSRHGFASFAVDRYNDFAGASGLRAPDPQRPSNAEHSRFLRDVLDFSLDRLRAGDPPPVAGAVYAGVRGVLHDTPGDRWGGTCQSHFLVVSPSGGLNTCPDRAPWEPAFSSVHDGVDAFSRAAVRRRWVRYQHAGHRHPDCPTCDFRSWCRSGCPITPQPPAGEPDAVCAGYQPFLRHVRRIADTSEGLSLLRAYLALLADPLPLEAAA